MTRSLPRSGRASAGGDAPWASAQSAMWRRFFAVGRNRSAPSELPLFATAENRPTFAFGGLTFFAAATLAFASMSFAFVGRQRRSGIRGPFPPGPRAFFSSSSVRSWRLNEQRAVCCLVSQRSNSAGNRISGFCAGGSFDVVCGDGWRDFGIGASLIAGRVRSPGSVLFRSPLRLSPPTTGILPEAAPGPMYFPVPSHLPTGQDDVMLRKRWRIPSP